MIVEDCVRRFLYGFSWIFPNIVPIKSITNGCSHDDQRDFHHVRCLPSPPPGVRRWGNDDDHEYVVFQHPSKQQIQLLAQSNDTISSVPGRQLKRCWTRFFERRARWISGGWWSCPGRWKQSLFFLEATSLEGWWKTAGWVFSTMATWLLRLKQLNQIF